MARYAISWEGLAELEQLRINLADAVLGIDEAGKQLFMTVEGLSDGLGAYEKGIYQMLRQMSASNVPVREAAEELVNHFIPATMQKIEELLSGFGSGTDDEDIPPQRKLVLRKR